eukprot:jgi/Chlat1/1960/Chrsp157S02263
MAKTPWVVVPMGVLFMASGLLVNVVELALLLTVWPLSKPLYRKCVWVLSGLLWSQLVWLAEWWGGVRVRLHGNPDIFKLLGNEHAICICNHRQAVDVDWLVGWVVAQHCGCLGGCKSLMKQSSKYLPVLGWSWWFSDTIFLDRAWATDQRRLVKAYSSLKDFPVPFWMVLFAEGTRFTAPKLADAQKFAKERGLPHIPRHTLVPKTKGFVSTVENLREFVPSIVDVTFAFPAGKPSPTMTGIFGRQGGEVDVLIRRFDISSLPSDGEGIAAWCRDLWADKDRLLERYAQTGNFGDDVKEYDSPPPLYSVWVLIGWLLAVALPSLYALYRAVATGAFTSTMLLISAGAVGAVALAMKIFIRYSQAEKPLRSAPASS